MNKRNAGTIIMIMLLALSFIAAMYIILTPGESKSSMEMTATPQLGRSVKLPGAKTIGVINIFSPISYSGQNNNPFGMPTGGALYWLELLKRVEKDDNIKALILRLNTPGGTIASTQEIYNQILRIKEKGKIVVVSMGDITASGGYYIAAAADYIVANPGTLTGSIGVIMSGMDLTALFSRFGLEYNVFKSGKYKDSMASYRKMSADERNMIQDLVMDAYWQFFNAVKEGRSLSSKKLTRVADGRILTAQQALDAGLIDELGDYEQAVKIAAEKAKLGKNYAVLPVTPDYRNVLSRYMNIFADKLFKTQTAVKLFDNQVMDMVNDSYVPIFYMYGM